MKKMILALLLGLGMMTSAQVSAMEMDKETMSQMVQHSIQKWKLNDGVSVQDAIESMQLRANLLNFMQVADLPLSEQVKALDKEGPYIRILAFCEAAIANEMVKIDIIYTGFHPCRIAVVEDAEGQGWITTMNMDMMLNAVELSPELEVLAKRVRDVIYEIVEAGVAGEF